MAKDCRSLARFDLKGIPPMTAGLPRIEVRFLIDANGILQVSALEQRSGKQAEVSVKPAYGLTDEQVESMILESFDYAEQDIHLRQLVEARNEAATILSAVEKAPSSPAWELLDPPERAEIALLSEKLRVLKDGDAAVSSAIRGQTMQSADDRLGQGPTASHPIARAEFQ